MEWAMRARDQAVMEVRIQMEAEIAQLRAEKEEAVAALELASSNRSENSCRSDGSHSFELPRRLSGEMEVRPKVEEKARPVKTTVSTPDEWIQYSEM